MKTMVKLLHVEGIPNDAILYAYINNLIIGIVKDRLIVRRE